VGDAIAATVSEVLGGASVDLVYSPAGGPAPSGPDGLATATAVGPGPDGWQITFNIRLESRIAPQATPDGGALSEILHGLPGAALRAAAQFDPLRRESIDELTPAMRRAVRDTVVIELLGHHSAARAVPTTTQVLADTIEFLIELSGTRVEAMDLTHGVLITNVLRDTPRLRFDYPADLRAAKRGPLLFDGRRSLLLIDGEGRARAELQRHRVQRFKPASPLETIAPTELVESGGLVAEATRHLGGIGLFLRSDRTIWAFAGGRPIVLRRGEHWTAFPLELQTAIASLIGGGSAAEILVQTAFLISAQRRGAILAIVEDPASLDEVVSPKDRYDLRNEFDPMAMRTETRLHHLIDADPLDAQTLARLATLDGATVLDRDAHLLAYGAIVTSANSDHEGARTAAAKTLSETADVVLKISVDGDITVFHDGKALATLLGQGART
jgi:hypothetical protein